MFLIFKLIISIFISNSRYIKELQIKRLKYYPRLHEKTDNLGNLIRNNCPIKDQTQLKNQLEVQLMEISNWDAHYAIYAGPQVTSELFNIRRALEKLRNSSHCWGFNKLGI